MCGRDPFACAVRPEHGPWRPSRYNQAKALDLLGNVDAAVQAYERFLALDAKGGASLNVRERIKQLRRVSAGGGVKPPP